MGGGGSEASGSSRGEGTRGGDDAAMADADDGSDGSPTFRGFSFKNQELLAERNLAAMQEEYEQAFAEFDLPPGVDAPRSATPSPQRLGAPP